MSNDNKVIFFHYELKNAEGALIDSSLDNEPFGVIMGTGSIVEGLETEILKHAMGDKFSVVVPPEKAYGERHEGNKALLERQDVPADQPLEIGMILMLEDEQGQPFPGWVESIDDNEVLLDCNHPMAGQTLYFDVELIKERAATPEELDHGHVHGEGGVVH